MKVSGYKISGGIYLGKPTIGTVGQLIFWYDYRFSIESLSGALTNWNDLGPRGFNLTQARSDRRLLLNADGIGANASGTNQQIIGSPNSHLNVLHDGSPHFIALVMRYNNAGDVAQNTTFLRTYSGSGAGINLAVSTGAINAIFHEFRSATGTLLSSHNTGSGTLPEDATYRLVTFTYYGSGGSSNSKISIASTEYTSTRNPTFPSGDPGILTVSLIPNTTDLTRLKFLAAYNLTGKSVAEIDAFRTNFFATLKTDSEYSGLTTL